MGASARHAARWCFLCCFCIFYKGTRGARREALSSQRSRASDRGPKWGLPRKGTSCLSRSFDGSKRCTQHPELVNLLVELEHTRRWFAHEC